MFVGLINGKVSKKVEISCRPKMEYNVACRIHPEKLGRALLEMDSSRPDRLVCFCYTRSDVEWDITLDGISITTRGGLIHSEKCLECKAEKYPVKLGVLRKMFLNSLIERMK